MPATVIRLCTARGDASRASAVNQPAGGPCVAITVCGMQEFSPHPRTTPTHIPLATLLKRKNLLTVSQTLTLNCYHEQVL